MALSPGVDPVSVTCPFAGFNNLGHIPKYLLGEGMDKKGQKELFVTQQKIGFSIITEQCIYGIIMFDIYTVA